MLRSPAGYVVKSASLFPPFGSAAWGGKLLTTAILDTCTGKFLAARIPYITTMLQQVGSGVQGSAALLADDAFKFAKRVRGGVALTHTLANNGGWIVGFWHAFNKTNTEILRQNYSKVYARFLRNGEELPRVMMVDNPRTMEAIVGATMPSLRDDRDLYASHRIYRGDMSADEIIVIGGGNAPDVVAQAVGAAQILRNAMNDASSGKRWLAWDPEWQYDPGAHGQGGDGEDNAAHLPTFSGFVAGFGERRVAVIVNHNVLRSLGVHALPQPIRELLEDGSIVKLGFSSGNDIAAFKDHFDCEVRGNVDMRAKAKQRHQETRSGGHTLADVVDAVLGKRMVKATVLRHGFNQALLALDSNMKMYLMADCAALLDINAKYEEVSWLSARTMPRTTSPHRVLVFTQGGQAAAPSSAPPPPPSPTADQIVAALKLPDGTEPLDTMTFGMHKGRPLRELPQSYVEWMVGGRILERSDNVRLRLGLALLGRIDNGIAASPAAAPAPPPAPGAAAGGAVQGGGDDDDGEEEEEGLEDGPIAPRKCISDVFHLMQELGQAFGTSNTHSPLLLKLVSEAFKFMDPVVKDKVLAYLTKRNVEKNHMQQAEAADEAKKQIHGFISRNPKYMAWGFPTAEEILVDLNKIEHALCQNQCTKKKGPARPLFTKKASAYFAKLKSLVAEGYVAPPANLKRSMRIGVDAGTGLDTYRQLLGTPWLEAFHNMQRDCAQWGTYAPRRASPRHLARDARRVQPDLACVCRPECVQGRPRSARPGR